MGYLMFKFCIYHVNETSKDNRQAATNEHNTIYDEYTSVNGDFYGSHLSQKSFIGNEALKLK